jgi:hypothetical protein
VEGTEDLALARRTSVKREAGSRTAEDQRRPLATAGCSAGS